MSNTIFKVLSDLKHDGDLVKAGTFIEGELGSFRSLVEDKVLAIVKGAETIEEAPKLWAKQEGETFVAPKAAEPVNTWEAKPDPTPEEVAAAEAAAKNQPDGVKADPEVKPEAVPTTNAPVVGTGDKEPVDDGANL